jgi:hypothetical protein
LSVTPGDRASNRTGLRLKSTLEKNNIEVKTLAAGVDAVEVPADAAMVVVADPRQPLSDKLVAAIRSYLTTPNKAGKKGKLLLLAGPHPKAEDGKGVAPTGLESLLEGMGVRLDPGYLFCLTSKDVSPTFALGIPNEELIAARNPIAVPLADRGLRLQNTRMVETPPAGPESPYSAKPLLQTPPNVYTWIESDPDTDPTAASKLMTGEKTAQAAQAARRLANTPRGLAAVVLEGDQPRAVVFGTGDFFQDRGPSAFPAELFANCVDWLRDRPAVATIANKTYGVFTPKADGGTFRGEILPVGLVLFAVLALGTGVWVTRRK